MKERVKKELHQSAKTPSWTAGQVWTPNFKEDRDKINSNIWTQSAETDLYAIMHRAFSASGYWRSDLITT